MALMALAAGALILAGCGSSSSSSAGPGSGSGSGASATSASSSTSTSASSSAAGAQIGFEGIPIEQGAELGPASTTQTGAVDGIQCGAIEQLAYHIHAHLAVYVNGTPRTLPAGIGIPGTACEPGIPIPAGRPCRPRKGRSRPEASASTGCTPTPRTA